MSFKIHHLNFASFRVPENVGDRRLARCLHLGDEHEGMVKYSVQDKWQYYHQLVMPESVHNKPCKTYLSGYGNMFSHKNLYITGSKFNPYYRYSTDLRLS